MNEWHVDPTTRERLQTLAAWGVDLSLPCALLRQSPQARVAGVLEAADGFVQRSRISRLLRPTLHPQPPRLLFQRLVEAEVDCVLVGGLAEIAQGVSLLTDHVELCFAPSAENVARLVSALLPLRPRWQDGTGRQRSPRFFVQQGTRLLMEHTPLSLDTHAARLRLDSALPGVGAYPTIKAAALPFDLYGCRLFVLALSALIAWRRARGLAEDETFLPLLESAYLLATVRVPDARAIS